MNLVFAGRNQNLVCAEDKNVSCKYDDYERHLHRYDLGAIYQLINPSTSVKLQNSSCQICGHLYLSSSVSS